MINVQKIVALRSTWLPLDTQKMQKKKKKKPSVLNKTFSTQISLSVKEGKNPHLPKAQKLS